MSTSAKGRTYWAFWHRASVSRWRRTLFGTAAAPQRAEGYRRRDSWPLRRVREESATAVSLFDLCGVKSGYLLERLTIRDTRGTAVMLALLRNWHRRGAPVNNKRKRGDGEEEQLGSTAENEDSRLRGRRKTISGAWNRKRTPHTGSSRPRRTHLMHRYHSV
jgi:hypothetical protein